MDAEISAAEAGMSDLLVASVLTTLDDAPEADDAAGLEQIAAALLLPLELAELPSELAATVLETIERRRDARAAGVLAAIGVLAGEPLAVQARAAAARLAHEGIASPVARRLGALTVREAVIIDRGDAELLVALLRRPGARTTQVAVLGIEHGETGGGLVECVLTPPVSTAEARELLESASGAEPIAAAELAARAAAGAQRAVEVGVALAPASAITLPLLARALTGDPQGLPRLKVLPPWESDDAELIVDAAEDEGRFHEITELLLDELEVYATSAYRAESAVWKHGDFVASSMLQWKGGYDDGRLARWTGADLAEYLLDYFPRKVSVDEETLAVVPECAIAFLRFLDARGSLSGEPLAQLEEACEALRAEFHERARAPSNWGLAKSMVMRMQAEGVDPGESGALEAWIAGFNERPRSERDAVVGGAADRMLAAAHRTPVARQAPAPERRSQRKAQRAARKRNRRHG